METINVLLLPAVIVKLEASSEAARGHKFRHVRNALCLLFVLGVVVAAVLVVSCKSGEAVPHQPRRLFQCLNGSEDGSGEYIAQSIDMQSLLDHGLLDCFKTTLSSIEYEICTRLLGVRIDSSSKIWSANGSARVLTQDGIPFCKQVSSGELICEQIKNVSYTWSVLDCQFPFVQACSFKFKRNKFTAGRRLKEHAVEKLRAAVSQRAEQAFRRLRGTTLEDTLAGSVDLVTNRRLGKYTMDECEIPEDRVPLSFGNATENDMVDAELPAGYRCKGDPISGWNGLGMHVTARQCHKACLDDTSCAFAVFKPTFDADPLITQTGGCSSFASCSSYRSVSWSPPPKVWKNLKVAHKAVTAVSGMIEANVSAGERCQGAPIDGWGDLGRGVTQQACLNACWKSPSCMFAVFRQDDGGWCSSFASCSSYRPVSWPVRVWMKV
jgi:hypothetical protein